MAKEPEDGNKSDAAESDGDEGEQAKSEEADR